MYVDLKCMIQLKKYLNKVISVINNADDYLLKLKQQRGKKARMMERLKLIRLCIDTFYLI